MAKGELRMASLTGVLKQNRWIAYGALLLVLGAVLLWAPAEATLGNVVKIVYLHGALERVSVAAYLAAGALGLAYIASRRDPIARWVRAVAETAIVFWIAQAVVSLPAQVLAWGAIVWNEPRVLGALWIAGLTGLTYLVARWINDAAWLALVAVVNAVLVALVLRGAVNIVHPPDAIAASDSVEIKIAYAALIGVAGLLALVFARERARVV
jgi:hypothetical protein